MPRKIQFRPRNNPPPAKVARISPSSDRIIVAESLVGSRDDTAVLSQFEIYCSEETFDNLVRFAKSVCLLEDPRVVKKTISLWLRWKELDELHAAASAVNKTLEDAVELFVWTFGNILKGFRAGITDIEDAHDKFEDNVEDVEDRIFFDDDSEKEDSEKEVEEEEMTNEEEERIMSGNDCASCKVSMFASFSPVVRVGTEVCLRICGRHGPEHIDNLVRAVEHVQKNSPYCLSSSAVSETPFDISMNTIKLPCVAKCLRCDSSFHSDPFLTIWSTLGAWCSITCLRQYKKHASNIKRDKQADWESWAKTCYMVERLYMEHDI